MPLIDNPAREHVEESRRANVVTVAGATVVTVAAYLATLGWNELQQYVTWQVWVFVVILAVEAAVAGWRGTGTAGAGTLGTVVTLVWLIDTQTDPETSGDAPMGLLFVLGGAFLGAMAVSSMSAIMRTAYVRHLRR